MQAFQTDIKEFEKLNAQVVGVSTDSLETHRKFSRANGITFPLIADDGTLKDLYSQRRTAYIIDQQGIIRFIYEGVPGNFELLIELDKLTAPKQYGMVNRR